MIYATVARSPAACSQRTSNLFWSLLTIALVIPALTAAFGLVVQRTRPSSLAGAVTRAAVPLAVNVVLIVLSFFVVLLTVIGGRVC